MTAAFAQSLRLAGRDWQIRASIGVSYYEPGDTAADLIGRAETAMYDDKYQYRKRAHGTSRCSPELAAPALSTTAP